MFLIEVENLKKLYTKNTGIDKVDFKLKKGNILALLGPNGAGKTTIIETILGLRKKQSGKVKLFSKEKIDNEIKSKIGFQLQSTYLDNNLKLIEYIELYKAIFKKKLNIKELLCKFDIKDLLNKELKNLSKGQYQRVLLFLAFIGNPELLFLDEPFTGLDPLNKIKLRNILNFYKKKGMTIIFTSHDIEEVEKICDEVAIIHNHKIGVKGKVDDLKKSLGYDYKATIEDNVQINIEYFSSKKIQYKKNNNQIYFYFENNMQIKTWMDYMLSNGIHEFKISEVSLLDYYLKYFGVFNENIY